MTVGTGFAGRSSIGENLEPGHLINWSRVAYAKDTAIAFPDYEALRPWERRAAPPPPVAPPSDDASAALREQIRRLVLEELRELVR
jgi:acetaldehyde dehydrogenase / alcohol dehydrogenase